MNRVFLPLLEQQQLSTWCSHSGQPSWRFEKAGMERTG